MFVACRLKENILSDEDLQPSIDAINILVEELAQDLLSKGRITEDQLHEDKGFLDRLTHLDKEFPNASVWLHKQPFQMPSAFQNLWSHESLLGVAEQMLGPDIAGHPVWNLRTKVPAFDQATVVKSHNFFMKDFFYTLCHRIFLTVIAVAPGHCVSTRGLLVCVPTCSMGAVGRYERAEWLPPTRERRTPKW